MSHHFLEVRDLWVAYPDGTEALRGLSFRLEHGESVGLVGANGAGKSTTLLTLAGLIMPREGSVNLGGTFLSKKTVGEIRRRIGFLFQDPDDQLFMPTVFDDVAFGPLNQGLSEEEARERVRAALNQVGAGHLAERPTYRLSGGEKRSVAIATVLSMMPDVLVMDEPSASLDPRGRRLLISLLKTFRHTRLIATHDLDLVLEVCPRTMVLSEGRLEADGETRGIFQDRSLLERCRLEPPLCMQGMPC
ncbi:MAG: ABC transporter ATP-binding protein [Synergistaceae bacterium]|nr:ABC transporter ATP-binding protein [Synergistaceae bacterium]